MQFLESEWWPNDHEGHSQWPPFSIRAERIPRCIFGANLVILAQIHYKLSCRQAKFPRIPSQNGQNVLEGQGQWPPFSILANSIPGCMFGANLVILAQICDELSHGEVKFPKILSQNTRNTLGCLDQYTCKGLRLWNSWDVKQSRFIGTCRGWRPWNSQAHEAV